MNTFRKTQVCSVNIFSNPLDNEHIVVDVQVRGADANTWSCQFRVPGTLETAQEQHIRQAIHSGLQACFEKVPRLTPPTEVISEKYKQWIERTIAGPRQDWQLSQSHTKKV